jgi:hypothetical protein
LYVVAGVVAMHLVIVMYLAFARTKDVIPKANLPYIPPPDPPNFGSRTYTETDPGTGAKYSVTEFVVSTKPYMTSSSTTSSSSGTTAPSNTNGK